MSELDELTHKIHVLLDKLNYVHKENQILKHELELFYKTNQSLKDELETKHLENEELKHELSKLIRHSAEPIQVVPQESRISEEREYGIPMMRIVPHGGAGSIDISSPRQEGGGKKGGGGGKKTSI